MTLRLKHFVGILLAVLMVAFASIRANAGTPTGIVFFNTSKVSSSDTNWDAVPYVHTGDAAWGSAHCMSSTSVSHVYYYAWPSTPTAVVFKNNNNNGCKQTEDGERYTVSGLLYTLSGNTNSDNKYTFVDAQGTVPTLTANKSNNDTYYSYNNVLTFTSEVGATIMTKVWYDSDSEPEAYTNANNIELKTSEATKAHVKVKTTYAGLEINSEQEYTFTNGGKKKLSAYLWADITGKPSYTNIHAWESNKAAITSWPGESMTKVSGNVYKWEYTGDKTPSGIQFNGGTEATKTTDLDYNEGYLYKIGSDGGVTSAKPQVIQSGASTSYYVKSIVTLTSEVPGLKIMYSTDDINWKEYTRGIDLPAETGTEDTSTTIYTKLVYNDGAKDVEWEAGKQTYTYTKEPAVIAIRGYKKGSYGFYDTENAGGKDVYDWVLSQNSINKNVFFARLGDKGAGIEVKKNALFSLVDGSNTELTSEGNSVHTKNEVTKEQGATVITGSVIDHGQYFTKDFWWNANAKPLYNSAEHSNQNARPVYKALNSLHSAFYTANEDETVTIYSVTVFRVKGMMQNFAELNGGAGGSCGGDSPHNTRVGETYYIYFNTKNASSDCETSAPFMFYVWGVNSGAQDYATFNDELRVEIPAPYNDKSIYSSVDDESPYAPIESKGDTHSTDAAVGYWLRWKGDNESKLTYTKDGSAVNGVEYYLTPGASTDPGKTNYINLTANNKMLFVDPSGTNWIRWYAPNSGTKVQANSWVYNTSERHFVPTLWHDMNRYSGNDAWDAYISAEMKAYQVRLWIGYNTTNVEQISTTDMYPSFNYRIDTFDACPTMSVTPTFIYNKSAGANTISLGANIKMNDFKKHSDDTGVEQNIHLYGWMDSKTLSASTDLVIALDEKITPTQIDNGYTFDKTFAIPTMKWNGEEFVQNSDVERLWIEVWYGEDGATDEQMFGPFYVDMSTPSMPKVENFTFTDEGSLSPTSKENWSAFSWKYNGTHFVNVAWGNTAKCSSSYEYPVIKEMYQYTKDMMFEGREKPYDTVYAMLAGETGRADEYNKYFKVFDKEYGAILKGDADPEYVNSYISSNTTKGKDDENWGRYCYAPESKTKAKQANLLYSMDTYLAVNIHTPQASVEGGWDGPYSTVPEAATIIADMTSTTEATRNKYVYSNSSLEHGKGDNALDQITSTVPEESWFPKSSNSNAIATLNSFDDFGVNVLTDGGDTSNVGSGRPDYTAVVTTKAEDDTKTTYLTNLDCTSIAFLKSGFPTGVDNVIVDDDTDVVIYGTDGAIVVNGAKSYNVYSPSGALLYSGSASTVPMSQGVYVVSTSKGKNQTVLVK